VRHRMEHVSLSFCGQRQILLETVPIDFLGYKAFRWRVCKSLAGMAVTIA
jgi:hypothetical protein